MNHDQPRPFFLNPLRISLPLTGLVSIGHRIAGAVLFLALPLAIYLLDLSLSGPAGFAQVSAWFAGWPLRLMTVLLLWFFMHHLAAGVRLLLMDAEIGVALPSARRSAYLVMATALAALALGVLLL